MELSAQGVDDVKTEPSVRFDPRRLVKLVSGVVVGK